MFTFLVFLILVDSVVLSFCTHDGQPHPGFALLCLVAFVVFVIGAVSTGLGLGIADVLWGIVTRPWEVVAAVLLYLGAGVFYAGFYKWRRLNKERAKVFMERKNALLTDFQNQVTYKDFLDYVKMRMDMPPSVSGNKERLSTWVGLWPFSALASVAYDGLYRLFTNIVEWCSAFWHRIQRRIWEKTGIYDVTHQSVPAPATEVQP